MRSTIMISTYYRFAETSLQNISTGYDSSNFCVDFVLFFNSSPVLFSSDLRYQLEEAEQYWFVFVLYYVRRVSENGDNVRKGLSLCQILRAARLKLNFHSLPEGVG